MKRKDARIKMVTGDTIIRDFALLDQDPSRPFPPLLHLFRWKIHSQAREMRDDHDFSLPFPHLIHLASPSHTHFGRF